MSSHTIAVICAGITGITTAYNLARRGHRVTAFDRHPYAAMETSFANGGQLSASNATASASRSPARALNSRSRRRLPRRSARPCTRASTPRPLTVSIQAREKAARLSSLPRLQRSAQAAQTVAPFWAATRFNNSRKASDGPIGASTAAASLLVATSIRRGPRNPRPSTNLRWRQNRRIGALARPF